MVNTHLKRIALFVDQICWLKGGGGICTSGRVTFFDFIRIALWFFIHYSWYMILHNVLWTNFGRGSTNSFQNVRSGNENPRGINNLFYVIIIIWKLEKQQNFGNRGEFFSFEFQRNGLALLVDRNIYVWMALSQMELRLWSAGSQKRFSLWFVLLFLVSCCEPQVGTFLV